MKTITLNVEVYYDEDVTNAKGIADVLSRVLRAAVDRDSLESAGIECLTLLQEKAPPTTGTSAGDDLPGTTVGALRAAMEGLPKNAPVVPAWFDGPPGDYAPAVCIHGFRRSASALQVLTSLDYLDGEEDSDDDDDFNQP